MKVRIIEFLSKSFKAIIKADLTQDREFLLPDESGTLLTNNELNDFKGELIEQLSANRQNFNQGIYGVSQNLEQTKQQLSQLIDQKISSAYEQFEKDIVAKTFQLLENIYYIKEHFIGYQVADTDDRNVFVTASDFGFKSSLSFGYINLIDSENDTLGILRIGTGSQLTNARATLIGESNVYNFSKSGAALTLQVRFRYATSSAQNTNLEDWIGYGDSRVALPKNGVGISIINSFFVYQVRVNDSVMDSGNFTLLNQNWHILEIHTNKNDRSGYISFDGDKRPITAHFNKPTGLQFMVRKSGLILGDITLDLDYITLKIDYN